MRRTYESDGIVNASGRIVTPADEFEVRESRCLHCRAVYLHVIPVVYVRLADNELIWWHRQGMCMRTIAI